MDLKQKIEPPIIFDKVELDKETIRNIESLKHLKLYRSLQKENKCGYCNQEMNTPLYKTSDHIIPLSKGGSNIPENKVPACNKCNSWKSNSSLYYWREDLFKSIKLGTLRGVKKSAVLSIIGNIEYFIDYIKSQKDRLYIDKKTYRKNRKSME